MKTRVARPGEASVIFRLIESYSAEGILLPRSEKEIRLNIGDFLVLVHNQRILGALSLEIYGPDLAEIRSLAVEPTQQGRGLGTRLLKFAMKEARRRRIARVFAVTDAPRFFLRQGFALGARESLSEKIERDCQYCAKRHSCKLHAVVVTLIPDHISVPIALESLVSIPL